MHSLTARSQSSTIGCLHLDDDGTSRKQHQSNLFIEVDKMKQIRVRTFKHWPHQISPSAAQMITAGFFDCTVGDRVICLYCNIICQQWTPNKDDPWEVHKTHSPKCPYVIAISGHHQETFNASINETMNRATCHSTSWSTKHVNWFPHRSHAKQLCLKELYQKIQKSRQIPSEYTAFRNKKQLTRLIKDRLDLPVSKNLVTEGFDLSIIESCYENQFRLTGDDFIDDCDLRMACTILQKQIKLIDGKQENIIILNSEDVGN